MNWVFIIAQILGVGAMIFSVLSLQCSTKKKVLIVQSVAAGLFCVQYVLLGAYTGAAMNGLQIVRNLVFHNKDKGESSGEIWTYVFIGLNVVAGILTWQGWISLLFIVGIIFNTIAMSCKRLRYVRVLMLASSPFILVYSILTKSIGGVLNELFAEVSAITALIRYKKDD